MKKITMFMLGAMAFGALTSCEDAPAEAPMQKNEQGPVLEATAVAITPEAVLSQTLNLDDYVDDSELALFTISKDELPSDLTLLPYMELSTTEGFDDITTVTLKVEGDKIMGDLADIQEAHLGFFGITATGEESIYYRVASNVENEAKVVYHLGNPDYYLASGVIKETPMVSLMPTDFWYTPGTYNNWNAAASQFLVAKVHDNGKYYYGTLMASGEGFKITNTTDWSGINYGGENGELSTSGPNIALPDGDGLYCIKAFTEDNPATYQMEKVTKIGVIGGGNWDADQELTPNDDFTVWTGEVTLDGEWKIRFNGNWDFNYGGALSNPTLEGDNFKGTGGSATVTITFSGHTPMIKVKAN